MSKSLRKAIVHRLRLKNVYNKYKTDKTIGQILKSKEFVFNLLSVTKAGYLQKLNVKDLSDNKNILKTIKPYFSKEKV